MKIAATLVFVSILQQQLTAVVSLAAVADTSLLFFQSLDNFVACGDGSPAGIYTDAQVSVSGKDDASNAFDGRHNHVINFQGGGGCTSEASCQSIWEQKPYFFSSLFESESITGHTLVSNDPTENPGMASFVKWLVPYCSQDIWLGSGQNSSGFIRSGSAHVNATLMHWLNAVQESNATVDTLVVSGVSAGTFAVSNHVDLIRAVSDAAGVKSLRLILDASVVSDQIDADFGILMSDVVDPNVHPLCFKNFTNVLQHGDLSQLPCCMSIHCMLRHSKSLADWTRINPENSLVKDERMLLIDSAYDPLQTFIYLTAAAAPSNAMSSTNGLMSLTGLSSSVFNIGEHGGKRKVRVLETLYAGERQLGPNVIWAMPSALLHNILVPSVEITTRACQKAQHSSSSCEGQSDCVFTDYPGGIVDSCNAVGMGLTINFMNGLRMTSWTTTETWKRVTVDGKSIQEVIYEFVRPNLNGTLTGHARLLIDSCPGPNCVPEGQLTGNSVQSLIEIEGTFASIPIWLITLITVSLFGIVILYIVIAIREDDATQNESSATNKKSKRQDRGIDIRLRGLCVESRSGEKILEDVDISLGNSTLTCLLGKSGAGKSTLLSVLSCQLKSNLDVFLKSGIDVSKVPCTYMRQLDLVTMENMTPIAYLHSTSKIYGVDKKNLDFVLGLVTPFFPVKKERDENDMEVIVLDPFENVKIKELSGGQRRMLAIAAALFQNTSLLLLDEPLSGLDSVSSKKVIDLLKLIAEKNAVTVLMTMHQPSNEILYAMDQVIVLAKGKVIFDNKFDTLGNDTSAAVFIHELLSEREVKTINHTDSFPSLQPKISGIEEEGTKSTLGIRRRLSRIKSEKKKTTIDTSVKGFHLWQVQPLARRLHLEYGESARNIITLPICFLIVAAWSRIDATNPLLSFLLNSMFTSAPTMLFQSRIMLNWNVLSAHLWDLQDKRISSLSYLLASGLQLLYFPFCSITLSLAIAYATLGWQWESFWTHNLFIIMTTVSALQLGKTMVAAMNSLQSVQAFFNVSLYLGLVFSGLVVNPNRVPSSVQWIMYASPFFWGLSGSTLHVLEHTKLGEQPCQSLTACVVYNPSFMAYVTGFPSMTTARTSMFALIAITSILVLVEYVLLRRKVVQRSNYTTLVDEEKDVKEECLRPTEIEYMSSSMRFSVTKSSFFLQDAIQEELNGDDDSE